MVLTLDSLLNLDIPRDQKGLFEPQIIKKHEIRITQMDEQILFWTAPGFSET